MTVAYLTFIK